MEWDKQWPIVSGRVGELQIHHSPKDFCYWNSVSAPKEANHITAVWHDIECNNFLISDASSKSNALHSYILKNDEEAMRQQKMRISVLQTLTRSIYRDLDIIVRIIRKHLKENPNSTFNKIDNENFHQLKNKIKEIRDHLIEHREKPDFYQGLNSLWTSFNSGTDITIEAKTKQGKEVVIHFNPLADAESLHQFLDVAFIE